MREAGYGRQEDHKISKKIRCDTLMWLTPLLKESLEKGENTNDQIANLRDLVLHTKTLKDMVNELCPKVNPNASRRIRLDGEEIQLAKYDGMLGQEQFYLRHKDAFKVDLNNLTPGQKLRKVTVLIYLNPDLDKVKTPNKLGELRLFLPDKIIDVVPHIGRVVIFKSEKIEHEVRSTLGYERFAVTVWFNQIVEDRVEIPKQLSREQTIFVGIPAYRDS